MRSSILAFAAVAAVANAAAVDSLALEKRAIIKRQSVTTGASDAVVLNFALTLEHLENAFYSQALARFTAADFATAGFAGVYPLLQTIASDEATHVSFLTSALMAAGVTPVQACNYTFPYTGVSGFLGLAQVLEGVGTSAYLGAAGSIATKGYLLAAGSILTVEARHSAFIRFLNGFSPYPAPFDTPQSASSVVTLATPFFASCPNGSAPAIPGHPAVTITTAAAAVGGMLNIAPTNSSLAASFTGTVYCGFASGLGAGFSTWTNGSCMIPTANVTDGQTYVVLTSGPSVADGSVLAGPGIINLGARTAAVTLNSTARGSSPAGAAATGGTAASSAVKNVAGLAAIVGAAFALVM